MKLVELWSLEDRRLLSGGQVVVGARCVVGPVAVGDRFTVGCTADGRTLDLDAVLERIVIFVDSEVDSVMPPYSGRFYFSGFGAAAGELQTIAGVIADADDPPIEPLTAAGESGRFRMAIGTAQRVDGELWVSGHSQGRLADGDRLLLIGGHEGTSRDVSWSIRGRFFSAGSGDSSSLTLDTDVDVDEAVGMVVVAVRPRHDGTA